MLLPEFISTVRDPVDVRTTIGRPPRYILVIRALRNVEGFETLKEAEDL